MKILGVDFGDARTGLALSDPSGSMAFGAGCIKSANLLKTAQETAEFAKKNAVSVIVVGNPVNMNGTSGPRAERVGAFAAHLRELSGIDVQMCDERLSTMSAHHMLNETAIKGSKRKTVIDELSATLILQSYLDARKNQK